MTAATTSTEPGVAGEPPALTHRQILTVLIGLMLGMLVAALSQTIVATALPTIVGELGGQDKLSWVVSATLLTATASTPIWGKLSDIYGRKLLFQIAIVVFLVGSLAAGFSQNMGELIGFRAVQGLGTGGLMALVQAIMGDIVPPRERGRYQGYLGSVFGLATVAGPLIGGFLVQHASWRWCFFVGIPVGLAALVVVDLVLKFPFQRRKHKVDWLGAGLIMAGVSAILLVLSLGGKEFGWNSAWTYGLAALGLVLLALAVWQERRTSEPIMPPRLFRNHTFVITSLAGFIVGIAMFGAMIFLPQYLQIVRGSSPTASGLQTLPLMVGMLGTSIWSGRVITQTGRYKIFPIVGMALVAVGLLLMSRLDPSTAFWQVYLFMFVVGAGLGLVMQVLVLAAQNSVDRPDLGVATSGSTFFRSMGGALGVALFGALLSNRAEHTIPARIADAGITLPAGGGGSSGLLGTPEAINNLPPALHNAVITGFADALQTAFLVAAPIALFGLLVTLFLRETRLRSGTDAAPSAEPAAAPTPADGADPAPAPTTAEGAGTDVAPAGHNGVGASDAASVSRALETAVSADAVESAVSVRQRQGRHRALSRTERR